MRREIGTTDPTGQGKGDCSVRAIGNAFGIDYELSHALCAAHGYRTKGRGGFPGKKLLAFLSALNVRDITPPPTRYRRPLWMSLAVLDKSKTYMVITSHHMFTVRQGVVMDTWDAHLRQRFARKIFEVNAPAVAHEVA